MIYATEETVPGQDIEEAKDMEKDVVDNFQRIAIIIDNTKLRELCIICAFIHYYI